MRYSKKDLLIVLLAFAPALAAAPRCKDVTLRTFEFGPEAFGEAPPLEFEGRQLPIAKVRFDLHELPAQKPHSAAEAVMFVEVGTNPLHDLVAQKIQEGLPGSNCNDRYRVKGVNVYPRDGQLKIDGYLGYERWECWYYDWICCEWFDCKTCTQEIRNKLFEVDPFVDGVIALSTDGKVFSASFSANVADGLSHDQRNLLKNLATLLDGVFNPGGILGTNFLSDGLNRKLDEVHSLGFSGSYPLPFGLQDEELEVMLSQFQWTVAKFDAAEGGTKAVFSGTTSRLPKQQVCDLQVSLIQQEAMAAQERDYVPIYTLQPGDSLWRIAEAVYGDGRYFAALLRANPDARMYPGVDIEVPRLREIVQQGWIVREGDSLWKIAERELGDGRRFRELIGTDLQGRDPSEVYPLDTLKQPEAEVPPPQGNDQVPE